MPYAEGERLFTICNSCRYCEGFCAVFPAMERRLRFSKADLNYLANVCHNCQECFYACQYAPPHEFAVNLPKVLSQIRQESYREFAWPAWLGRMASGLAWACVAGSIAGAIFSPPIAAGDFYGVVPHSKMVAVFVTLGLAAAVGLGMSLRRFRCEGVNASAIARGLRDAMTLRYLKSSGAGCAYPEESQSGARRMLHHAVFYGFLLCFLSTTVAAMYHYLLGRTAPYAYTSLPVLLGTAGGVGIVLGVAGLAVLKLRADSRPREESQKWFEWEFLVLLLWTSATGLALLGLREGPRMPGMLFVHLGAVAGLFLTLPYGKFVHGFYRALALVRYALESSSGGAQ